jgi:hypothetical protein
MTTEPQAEPDAEFAAMHTVYSALVPLGHDARARVISYILKRLEIDGHSMSSPRNPDASVAEEDAREPSRSSDVETTTYGSFAELFDAAGPQSEPDKALVAGYWLQVCQGSESGFDGFSVNKELRHLGEGASNITVAFDRLKNQKPALALQLKKGGKTQQARKTYKITTAGVRAVEVMING